MEQPEPHLRNCRVLVTRPEHSARGQIEAVAAYGGAPTAIPALAITALEEDARRPAQIQLKRLESFDHIIFTSANAVRCAFELLDEMGRKFPRQAQCYAMGPVTGEALSSRGIEAATAPGTGSEAMARMPELGYVREQRALIVCGVDARPWLGERLRERGAEVDYCAVYRRLCPGRSGPPLRAALRAGALDAALAASLETLQNLIILAGGALPLLRELPLCAPSERVAEQARARNFRVTLTATDARDEEMVKELARYWTYWTERGAQQRQG